jgi:Lon protease-like protein
MVKDAIATHGLIGMALLKGEWQEHYYGNPDIFSVGCLGKIINMTPFPDGRSNIILEGLREYEIKEHILGLTPYRQAKVLLRDELIAEKQVLPASRKAEVVRLIKQTVRDQESALPNLLGGDSIDEETWLNFCSFSLDISTLEKQSLLEAKTLEERVFYLLDLLHFRAGEKGTPFRNLVDSGDRKPPH